MPEPEVPVSEVEVCPLCGRKDPPVDAGGTPLYCGPCCELIDLTVEWKAGAPQPRLMALMRAAQEVYEAERNIEARIAAGIRDATTSNPCFDEVISLGRPN